MATERRSNGMSIGTSSSGKSRSADTAATSSPSLHRVTFWRNPQGWSRKYRRTTQERWRLIVSYDGGPSFAETHRSYRSVLARLAELDEV